MNPLENWHSQPDAHAIRAEGVLLTEPLYQAARPRITEHVRLLQQASSLEGLFNAQRSLLIEFGARQRVDDGLRADRRRLNREIKAAVESDRREEVLEKQRLLEIVKRQEHVLAGIQHALRCVADGIAWKALRYDRLAIAVFGRGRRVGRLAEGVGFTVELQQLGAFWDRGILALHNDLTNVLRHGDLTVLRWPSHGELEAEVIEVKTGRVDPNSAQLRRIDAAIEFLQKGIHPTLADGGPLAAIRLRQRYRTFQTDLVALLSKVRRTGFGWISPSPCLAVMAVDLTAISGRVHEVVEPGRAHEVVEPGRARMEQRLKWWSPGRLEPIVWSAGLRRMFDRTNTVAAIAPFSIFRMPAAEVADLLLGYVDYVVYLNTEVLEAMFAARGLKAQVARPPESLETFLSAGRGSGGMTTPATLRAQMMIELMTPATLITAVEESISAARRRTDNAQLMVVFDDESSVWG